VSNKYTSSDYFFQFVTVTVGVLIALLINGLVEWNRDRELVAEARATIAQEIAANKKDLESSLSGLAVEKTRLEAAIRFASEMLATKKTTVNELQLHLNLADVSSTGWLTAARTGALAHMPYDEVQKYSRLYDLQDLFTDQQRRMLERLGTASAMLSSDFNPDNPNPKDLEAFRMGVMELRSALNIHEQMGRRLSDRYAEALKP
jgi:hypothetical protein